MFSFDSSTLIFADGLYPTFGGKLWSCLDCIDKTGFMMGRARKDKFDQKHKGHRLFQSNLLNAKTGKFSKQRWGKPMEEEKMAVPYGCPKESKPMVKPKER